MQLGEEAQGPAIWSKVWADSEMYSRVKLQLFIIYTVVRILNKVLRLFLFASYGSRRLQPRQKFPPTRQKGTDYRSRL